MAPQELMRVDSEESVAGVEANNREHHHRIRMAHVTTLSTELRTLVSAADPQAATDISIARRR